jgi:hypothetical protein
MLKGLVDVILKVQQELKEQTLMQQYSKNDSTTGAKWAKNNESEFS